MDIQLISTGLTNLDPGYYRSPGVHASTLLDRICRRLGHYQHTIDKLTGAKVPISDRNRELGQAFEHSIAQRVQAIDPNDPQLPVCGPFIHNPEILCDGVYITPDLVTGVARAAWSIKLTWMSAARGPDDVKMWKYLEQLKAELYALRRVAEGTAIIRHAFVDRDGTGEVESLLRREVFSVSIESHEDYLTGYLTVCFVNDWRPTQEQIPTWRVKFWPEELAMSWAALMDEKEGMEMEQLLGIGAEK